MSVIRQQQVGSLIKRTLSEIFTKEGRNIYGNAFVTITQVRLTPDLSVARIYLSVYNKNKEEIVTMITENEYGLRRLLGNRIRNKVRHIPNLEFYLDDTLDEVYKMDELLNSLDIQPEKEENENEEEEQ